MVAAAAAAAWRGTGLESGAEYRVPIGGGQFLRMYTDATERPLIPPTDDGAQDKEEGEGGDGRERDASSLVLDVAEQGHSACDPGSSCRIRVAETGRVLWPVSVLLLHTLAVDKARWKGKRCLELGSGTGTVGLALSEWGASVVLSDLPHMIPTIEASVRRNQQAKQKMARVKTVPLGAGAANDLVQIRALDWNKPHAAPDVIEKHFDLILAADVVYHKSAVGPLLTTIIAACQQQPQPPIVLVAFHERSRGYLARYFRVHARRAGFRVTRLPADATLIQASLSEVRDAGPFFDIYRHSALLAISAAADQRMYILQLDFLPGANDWVTDKEMWSDLTQMMALDPMADNNPHAVAVIVDREQGQLPAGNTVGGDEDPRLHRMRLRREARQAKSARQVLSN